MICAPLTEKFHNVQKKGKKEFSVVVLFVFQLGADVGISNPSMKSMKTIMRIMAVAMIPLTAQFPAVSLAVSLVHCS